MHEDYILDRILDYKDFTDCLPAHIFVPVQLPVFNKFLFNGISGDPFISSGLKSPEICLCEEMSCTSSADHALKGKDRAGKIRRPL